MDKLIDEIIELILEDMDCHHEVDHEEDGVHTSVEYNLKDETKLREKIGELIDKAREATLIKEQEKAKLIWDATCPGIDPTWLPTAENINALPKPLYDYIAGLETNADPPSMVADNIILRDTIKALEIKLEEKPGVTEEELFEIKAQEYERGLRDAKPSELSEITEAWTDTKAKEIKALIEQAQDEDLSDPWMSLHYLGLSLDIVTSIIDDLRPDKRPEIDYKFFRPPGRDKKLDAQFVRLLEESKRLGIGEKEFINGILKEYKKRSEIEVEKK